MYFRIATFAVPSSIILHTSSEGGGRFVLCLSAHSLPTATCTVSGRSRHATTEQHGWDPQAIHRRLRWREVLDDCGSLATSSFTMLRGNVRIKGVGFWVVGQFGPGGAR